MVYICGPRGSGERAFLCLPVAGLQSKALRPSCGSSLIPSVPQPADGRPATPRAGLQSVNEKSSQRLRRRESGPKSSVLGAPESESPIKSRNSQSLNNPSTWPAHCLDRLAMVVFCVPIEPWFFLMTAKSMIALQRQRTAATSDFSATRERANALVFMVILWL